VIERQRQRGHLLYGEPAVDDPRQVLDLAERQDRRPSGSTIVIVPPDISAGSVLPPRGPGQLTERPDEHPLRGCMSCGVCTRRLGRQLRERPLGTRRNFVGVSMACTAPLFH
jgi:hypothetical protein